MTVRYANTIPDLLAFCAYSLPRSPVMLGIAGIGIAIITYLHVQMFWDSGFPLLPTVITFLIFQCAAIDLMFGIIAILLVLVIIVSHTKTSRAEHTITLADDIFTEETIFNRTEHRWNGVLKIRRTKKHLFIYIFDLAAHVIPRRAFESDEQWDAFHEFCMKRIERA